MGESNQRVSDENMSFRLVTESMVADPEAQGNRLPTAGVSLKSSLLSGRTGGGKLPRNSQLNDNIDGARGDIESISTEYIICIEQTMAIYLKHQVLNCMQQQ